MSFKKIDYEEIIENYPWLLERNHKCVISPDADGMRSGLFMSHYLNWEVVGYYDNGKNLILKKGVSAKECIFIDTEIYRKEIRSCGHHIVLYSDKHIPENWGNFSNCLNPNNLRNRTSQNQFGLKYPMGTIHFLLCVIGYKYNIEFSKDSLFVILQADGTINRFIDRYSENLMDWLNYLDVFNGKNTFGNLLHHKIDLLDFSKEYVNYVQGFVKAKKDKIPISGLNGLIRESFNSSSDGFSNECKKHIENYLYFISKKTGWALDKDKWLWGNFKVFEFTKKSAKPGVKNFSAAVKNNFLSLAFTSSLDMEYTLEKPDKLP